MNKLDSTPPTLALSPASLPKLETGRRLIVLIPDVESDYTPALSRVWELAIALGSRVQFLGLCRDVMEESRLRRGLVTMSALVQDGRVSAESRIVFGSSWVKAVKSDWQAGDVFVCFAEQRAGLLQRPLSQILESNLKATVYVFDAVYPTDPPRSNWLSAVLGWSGSLAIIAGFFWMQVRLIQLPNDWGHTSLMYLSVLVEIGLIAGWNFLFS